MSSTREKPRARASLSQRSSSSVPTPRRAFDGSTKNARIFAACVRGIEQRGVAVGARVAAEQRRAKTPAAASGELAVFLGDEVGLIVEQLRVDAERAAQRPLDLGRPVVLHAQAARGARDQCGK